MRVLLVELGKAEEQHRDLAQAQAQVQEHDAVLPERTEHNRVPGLHEQGLEQGQGSGFFLLPGH